MAKRIKPNGLFEVWSPDEVAECLNVTEELYAKIWNKIVPKYEGKPRSEVPDDFDRRCLKKFWRFFTDEEKAVLNAAAELHESTYDSWKKNADKIDGKDRDDLGDSPDY